jgi:murein DD-endopeptidase MepM/ murein hydrolase activator NlpD
MRAVFAVLLTALLVTAGGVWWLKFEHHPPQARLIHPLTVLGAGTPVDLEAQCDRPGLRTVTVQLQAGGTSYELFQQTYPAASWLGSRLTRQPVHIQADLRALKVPEGSATLDVFVDTYAWHLWRLKPAPVVSIPVTVDLTPPRIELLTTQHNVRLGGVELVVFRQSPDTARSGVAVESYFFPSTTGYFADPNVALAFFAIPQDLTDAVRPRLVAEDAAGNERDVYFPCRIKAQRFAERTLAISDDFLARKVPEIERANNLPAAADLLKGYVFINRELRKQNEAQIRKLTEHSAPEPLWDGAFHRQSNAASLSSFADRRTYTYGGEVIDHETHLGYDLASLKNSPVEAAQNGIVVHAGNLGIYGNAVIVDHGLGIFSLYGHLSTIAVHEGEHVKAEQTLGQTGETGLAGGDHLHFSILLYGVQVDPVEWWDAHWLHDHVTPKLTMLPRATSTAANP